MIASATLSSAISLGLVHRDLTRSRFGPPPRSISDVGTLTASMFMRASNWSLSLSGLAESRC